MDSMENGRGTMRRKGRLAILLTFTLAAGGALAAIATDHTATHQDGEERTSGRSLEIAESARTRPPTRALSNLNEDELLAQAYKAVFGKPQVQQVQSGDYVYSGGKLLHVGNEGLILIAPANHREAYPINMGAVGIFYLVQRNGALVVKGRWPDFIGGSIMGNAPEWEVRRDLTDFPVIVSTAGGVWQGYMCQSTTVVELRPETPMSIANFDSVYSNSGAKSDGERTTDLEGKIGISVKNAYFDVNFDGTQSFMQRYVRGPDGKYTLRPGSELLPTC